MKPVRWIKALSLGIITVLATSCGEEIVDFFEAIKDYGYRSTIPLGPKKVPVDETLVGGYVYEGLPVIISKKDETTYRIEFLSTQLNRENTIIDAHSTELGNSTFLNLVMGDYYCFMRTSMVMNTELQVELLKDDFKEHVGQDRLKTWLETHSSATTYSYTEYGEPYGMEIYFSFIFTRVTVQEALRIQEQSLRLAKMDLFNSCSTYSEYEMLMAAYPNDEFKELAIKGIYNGLSTVDEYKQFIAYFPNHELAAKAKAQIDFIIEELQVAEYRAIDKKNYEPVKLTNTIEAYEEFLKTCQTKMYRDSANQQIKWIASSIRQADVEWKWTNGESAKAIQLLYYKVDYLQNTSEIPWIVDLLSLYTLKHNDKEYCRKSLLYLDKIAEQRISGDDYLDLYISKGFLLWSLSEYQLCLQVFQFRLDDTFDSGVEFKDAVKQRYAELISFGIAFPDQNSTWKKIKKLKPLD